MTWLLDTNACIRYLNGRSPKLPTVQSDPRGWYRHSVFDTVAFVDLDDSARCQLAKFFILRTCPSIGSFCGNGDGVHFLANVASDVATWPMGSDISSRRLEHIAYALDVASQNRFTESPVRDGNNVFVAST